MPVNPFVKRLLITWAVTLVAILMLRSIFSAAQLSLPEVVAWLFLAAAPPAVVLIVFRRTPPTIAQVLYEAEHPRVDRGGRVDGR